MKKGILLIAAAALALGSNNAFAAAPNWYNFQGACAEKGATVNVEFVIVNKTGDVLYSETHSDVQTNENGVFTLHVGEGVEGEGAMPSTPELNAGGLTLITKVNGVELSQAAFGAVPYASQAAAVGEFSAQDLVYLFEGVSDLYDNANAYDDQIFEISKDVQGISESLRGKASIDLLVDKYVSTEDLDASMANFQENIENTLKGYVTTEDLDASMSNFSENIENALKAYVTTEDLEIDMNNFQENIEMALKAYVTTEDLDASMANFQENIELALKAYVTTEDLDASMANFNENIELALKAYVTTEDLDASMANFQENIENALKAYVTTEDLDASMANFNENIQNALAGYVTTEDLDASMENFNENLGHKFTEVETSIADILAKNENYENSFESLKSEIEQLQNAVTELLSIIETNQEQSNEVTKTLMNVIDDVDALQTKVEALEKAAE